jgi:hypothetical protein
MMFSIGQKMIKMFLDIISWSEREREEGLNLVPFLSTTALNQVVIINTTT